MRVSLVRGIALLAIVFAIAWPSAASPEQVDPTSLAPARNDSRVPAPLSPEVLAATLRIEGRVVRREPGLTVERVRLPAELRSGQAEVPPSVWRVTLAGRFPPRALRYVVFAGRRPIGYGVPRSDQGAVRTATTDPAVLTSPITVRYGDGAPPPAEGDARSVAPVGEAGGRLHPAAPGAYAVTRDVYRLGEEVFQPSDLGAKVELIADVHYPTGLPDGPYPLVLFMHGNHSSCYRANRSDYRWPCKEGWKPLPNYAGYDYIGKRLASYGFIVVSVSANGVNVLGNRVDDTGMRQRGEVLEKHIDLWKDWSTTGGEPFGTTFVGKVDLARIGTMGHSRGGEGVVWNTIVDRERPDPYGIDAVLALAPVDFTRVTINEVPFAVVLPYCDGDVSDLQGVHFFDDSRYLVPGDPAAKHTVTAFGANHNFFNTVWSPSGGYPGAFDDGRSSGCTDRLAERPQRRVGRAYIVGFFRRYLADETSLDPIWTGAATPASIAPASTLVSYLAPDTPERRMDVDRFTGPEGLSAGQLGGAVTASEMSLFGWCADAFETACFPGDFVFFDVHLSGLAQGVLGWSSDDGVLRFEIPPAQSDVSGLDAFQFRAAVNPAYFANRRIGFQDLAVVLEDGAGDTAEVIASDVGNQALAFPLQRRRSGHIILNQIRFALDRFQGVDLTDMRAVELRFSRTEAGAINIADVAFSAGAD